MKSYKAAILLITRKRLFSETTQSLFSHNPFKGQYRLPLCRSLGCFTDSQCVVQVREQKFAWHRSEALGNENHIQSKLRGPGGSKPSKTVFWVRPPSELSSVSPGLQYLNRTGIQATYQLGNTGTFIFRLQDLERFWGILVGVFFVFDF